MKSRILGLVAVGLLAGLVVAPEARAVSISAFSYLGDDGTTLTFALPTQPIDPPQVVSGGFDSLNVDIVLNETPTIAHDISFFTAANGGGFDVNPVDAPGFGAFGPVVFSGTTTAPTFVDGVYEMLDFDGLRQGTMTITSTVPEPGTLTLLGLGLASLGLMRRRKVH